MIGETLGSYRIISEIGSGGMGVVYLAEHTLLGRKAAIKLLRSDMPEEYVERFFNEAKAAATLHHPGLVDVFDFGHHADGSAYIVMEYLAGESLSERLTREPKLPVPIALAITRSVAMALHVAHELGIIHRDLKPANIFLIPDVEAPAGVRTKVLDFGIAKLMRDRDARSVKTQSGAVIGTPRYMSPEQCKNAKTVDARSDIYSLGCILYEMLLGVAPFDYDSWAELVGAHIYEEPAKPSEIDAAIHVDVETLVQKMLEKSADDRFATMDDLSQSLEVLLRTYGIERVRLTPPSLQRPTPTGGTKKVRSGQDPTLPQSGERTASGNKPSPGGRKVSGTKPISAETGAFADTAIKAATGATLARDVTQLPLAKATDIVTEPLRKVRRVPWLAIGIGSVGVLALGIAGVVMVSKKAKPESETAFIVVDQRGSAEGSATAKLVEDPPVTLDAGVAIVAAPDAGAGSATTPPKVPTETDVGALTRTFGKQSGAITACFKQHGEVSEKVMVRIQIDRMGVVQAAEVIPDSVGATPLGACIVAVARKTSFGAQPKGAAFRVPLHTSAR